MSHEKLIEQIVDGELKLIETVSMHTNYFLGTQILQYLKGKAESENAKLTLRYVLPLLATLHLNPEVKQIIRLGCDTFHEPYSEERVKDVLRDLGIEVIQMGIISAIGRIRAIGGEKIHELLGALLGEADEKGIERGITESDVTREVVGWLGETRYLGPEHYKHLNDSFQIADLLQEEMLRSLGLYLDDNTADILPLPTGPQKK